ncbi:ABC-2 family transporter protein [Rosistilla carotiformis]|uniref:ABC-2 family transporter protein n=1 Tax=Rosistilla carotiformis TaxID=2528017 RepID=A0A518JYM3_9BACT|nr:ABC transporter permease subunit [Rosistilla carotiformis]QDV70641.1 ABC-2 family transporter protein [Rosistilla carotiformis]
MTRVLIRKYVGEAILLWLACALALVSFNVLRVWLVSQMEMDRFKAIIEQFREYERFSPIPFDQLFSYVGRIGMTFDEPIVVLCIVVWVIARGSDVVSGELGRGTLEMLLAQPVTRSQVMRAHGTVAVLGLAGLSLCVWLGIWIGIMLFSVKQIPPAPTFYIPLIGLHLPLPTGPAEPIFTPMRQFVSAEVFGVGVLNLFAFGFALLGISTWLSSIDRYRWRSVGVTIGFYVVNVILMIASQATERLDWLKYLTYFTCYMPQEIIQHRVNPETGSPWQILLTGPDGTQIPGPFAATLFLFAIGTAGYCLALRRFNQRDLPAPV